MNLKLTALLSFVFLTQFCFGQTTISNIIIDTLKIIETQVLKDENIQYQIEDGSIYFSKELTIQIWTEQLNNWQAEIDSTPNSKSWEIARMNRFNASLEYIITMDTLIFSDPWENDSITHPKQIENNIQLLSAINFYEIGCTMLESGHFKLILNGEEKNKVIKAEVYEWDKYSGQRSIKYLADENKELWICPPMIHDQFVIEN